MSSLQVRLNGTPIRGRIEGLESFSVTYSRDEQTGATQKAYTNELKFFDDGFDLIFNTLVASQQGLYKYIKVQIWDECCNDFVYQDFIIKGDSVDYCTGDCFVVARMTRQDPDERIYDCFKRTPITTDLENPDGSFNTNHWLVNPNSTIAIPKIPYCNEMRPALFFYVFLSMSLILFFVVGAVNTLISLAFPNNPIATLLTFIGQGVTGCGRLHPSPYIKDYINEASIYCQCNQNQPFVSSFLENVNSRYYSVALINAPLKKGVQVNSTTRYIVENRPRQTITEFLDMVAKDFNALWWIENGRVYMERKDYYFGSAILLDAIAESKKGNILNGACFKYNQGKVHAGQRIEAQNDMSEKSGNEKNKLYSGFFDYIRIHNSPAGWEAWDGILDKQLSYAPIAFRPYDSIIDGYPLIGLLNTTYPNLGQFQGACVFQDNEFAVHKYFEADPTSNDNFKKPRVAQLTQFDTINNVWVTIGNAPNPVFNIIEQNNFTTNTPNIYNDFHSIDDPINNPYRFWDYEIEAKMDCVMVKNLSVNRTVRMQTPYGTSVQGKINTIIANFGDRTIRITGEF
jgi:hypothetical protein